MARPDNPNTACDKKGSNHCRKKPHQEAKDIDFLLKIKQSQIVNNGVMQYNGKTSRRHRQRIVLKRSHFFEHLPTAYHINRVAECRYKNQRTTNDYAVSIR